MKNQIPLRKLQSEIDSLLKDDKLSDQKNEEYKKKLSEEIKKFRPEEIKNTITTEEKLTLWLRIKKVLGIT